MVQTRLSESLIQSIGKQNPELIKMAPMTSSLPATLSSYIKLFSSRQQGFSDVVPLSATKICAVPAVNKEMNGS